MCIRDRLASQFFVTDSPQRTQIPLSIVVHWGSNSADTSDALHMLAPDQCNDAIVAQIPRWQRNLESTGPDAGGAEWATAKIARPSDE
eukprot:2654623-Pyramimonas_sp.AAC.1